MECTEALRRRIAARRTEDELADVARAEGMVPLASAGLAVARTGDVTLEDVLDETGF